MLEPLIVSLDILSTSLSVSELLPSNCGITFGRDNDLYTRKGKGEEEFTTDLDTKGGGEEEGSPTPTSSFPGSGALKNCCMLECHILFVDSYNLVVVEKPQAQSEEE